jgi:hypothetical protein
MRFKSSNRLELISGGTYRAGMREEHAVFIEPAQAGTFVTGAWMARP